MHHINLSCYITYSGHVLAEHPLESIGKSCFQYQLIMVLQMFDFKGHGLANRLIDGSNDGGMTSFDYHPTRKETKRDDFHATDHWIPRIGY